FLMAMWVQPENSDGTYEGTNLSDDGFWGADVWGATSSNAGMSWSAPFRIIDTPTVGEDWTTLDPVLEPLDDGNYRYHALWYNDTEFGVSLFNQGDSSNDPWVYATGTLQFIVNDVNGSLPAIPFEYSLSQNSPNPFNPTTTIEYSLPKAGVVLLIVYNLLGQEVAFLVNDNMPAGNHKVRWDASNMASVVYLYRLEVMGRRSTSPTFVRTRKMVLLK
ncbi:MAG: T9SS type A sorting domain-containing protein, partial [Candidatus Marinimicrobia bacterium]|nr:T9SS type A sorting domain-containing protein [Candidatus Neomarinimicrobiota bacterium]